MWSDITTGPETQIWLCVTKKYSGLHYSDKMSNRVEFIRDFIEIYQSFPCLWKIKSPEYCNREKRKEGYSKLIEFYHLHAPEEQANEAVIKKKIQALRTVWRKELNKVLHTTKSGASTEEVRTVHRTVHRTARRVKLWRLHLPGLNGGKVQGNVKPPQTSPLNC
ncbi:uncharacterized protein [Ranitomeya imitator]|uniref:uncharacterized protein isoform X5 n=1 Tax=Ranitomeya imitator TaxID=111125 RepID=UPI0037E8B7F6